MKAKSLLAVVLAVMSLGVASFSSKADVLVGYSYQNMDLRPEYNLNGVFVSNKIDASVQVLELDYEQPIGQWLFIAGYDTNLATSQNKFTSNLRPELISDNSSEFKYSRWNVGFGQVVWDGAGRYKFELYQRKIDVTNNAFNALSSDLGVNFATEYRLDYNNWFAGFELSAQLLRNDYKSNFISNAELDSVAAGIGLYPFIGYSFSQNLHLMMGLYYNRMQTVYRKDKIEFEANEVVDYKLIQMDTGYKAQLEWRF